MRRAKIILAVGLLLATLPGMATAAQDESVNTGELPADCVKFDSDVILDHMVSASVAGVTVTITDWELKDGETDEFVGFTYTVSGGTFEWLSIKSGNGDPDTAPADGHWSNRAETKVKGISNIVFCGAQLAPPPLPDDDPDF